MVVGGVQRLGNKAGEVAVRECVDHPSAIFLGVDQAGEAQFAQMLADSRSRRTTGVYQGGDICFAVAQAHQQRESGPIGE